MGVITLDIKPDRFLLDSNFDGYKLSLEELKVTRKNLEVPVDKTFLKSSQYSLLHAKLFGLHNHLFVDQFENFASVYFADKNFNIKKTYVDKFSNELIGPINILKMPKSRPQTTGDYNITLRFACPKYAVASDGMGTLFILDTKDKNDDDLFEILFQDKVLNNEDQGFIITDALYNDDSSSLHVLLLNIQEDSIDHFASIIHWLTFKQIDDGKTWGQTALRQLKTKGEVGYLHLEKNCENIYVVSDKTVEFVLNSEHPIQRNDSTAAYRVEKIYQWSQTLEDVTVKFPLQRETEKSLIKVISHRDMLDISYNSQCLLSGELGGEVDPSLLTWSVTDDNILEVVLSKTESRQFWKELIKGDVQGEYLFDASIIDQSNERLQAFTSETEDVPQAGVTFNSQQIEECDFETDKSEVFERINGVTSQASHVIHLGSHQIILAPYLISGEAPALGIRQDVDVCLWQPIVETNNFSCKHQGTLLALGYVQASKTNRKYVACSPDLSYAVISEASGHIFIYRQNKPLLATELRHRSTGRRVKSIAQQHVFNLPNQDILGIFASNLHLFLLGENFVIALNINAQDNE